MSVITQTGFTDETFERFLAGRDEPDWLRDMRAESWRKFNELPLPSQRDEEWMRTDIRLLRLDKFGLPGDAPGDATVPPGLLTHGVELGGHTVALDSRPQAAQLADKWAKRGVLFGSLDELVREHGEVVRKHLFRAVDPAYDKFAALHAATWSGGTLLYVPRGVTIDEPLHMLSAMSAGAVDLGHALVILEDGAEATLLAETASLAEGTTGLHCGAVELLVGPGAKLRYVNFQNWANGVWHFAHQKACVDSDAALQWTIAALGSRLVEGEPTRVAGRRRRHGPGQWRDVHRGQTAPGVQHAATSRSAVVPQRSALQGRAAGCFAHRVAGHDPRRRGRSED